MGKDFNLESFKLKKAPTNLLKMNDMKCRKNNWFMKNLNSLYPSDIKKGVYKKWERFIELEKNTYEKGLSLFRYHLPVRKYWKFEKILPDIIREKSKLNNR
jgi:hypothetical protein